VAGPSMTLPASGLELLMPLLRDGGDVQAVVYGEEDEGSVTGVLFRLSTSSFREVTLTMPVIAAPYPDFSRVIEAAQRPATVVHLPSSALTLLVRRASLFHQEGMTLTVSPEDGRVEVAVEALDGRYHDALDVKAEGESMRVGFVPRFLLDALKALADQDTVRFLLTGPNRPAFLLPEQGDSPLHVVMPLKLNRDEGKESA